MWNRQLFVPAFVGYGKKKTWLKHASSEQFFSCVVGFFAVYSVNVTVVKKSVPKFLIQRNQLKVELRILLILDIYWLEWLLGAFINLVGKNKKQTNKTEHCSLIFLLAFLWDQCAPHRVAKAATHSPIFCRGTGPCSAASQRRSRLFSPKCLRVHRFPKWPVDTDSPWCSPARCLREGETSAAWFSNPGHTFLMSVKVSWAYFHLKYLLYRMLRIFVRELLGYTVFRKIVRKCSDESRVLLGPVDPLIRQLSMFCCFPFRLLKRNEML